ncbi:MAG: hypothetical protein KME29_04300 [Calothrix sp. FI2-JRJ7]|nr:hypothetical protein [Calothrix sp. FI2-JRJ7]
MVWTPIFICVKLEGTLDEGKGGYQTFKYEQYKIEVLPLAGIKVLYNDAYLYKKPGLTQLAQSVSARLRRAINTQSGTSYIMLGA